MCLSAGEVYQEEIEEKENCNKALRTSFEIYTNGFNRWLTFEELQAMKKEDFIKDFLNYVNQTLLENVQQNLEWKE